MSVRQRHAGLPREPLVPTVLGRWEAGRCHGLTSGALAMVDGFDAQILAPVARNVLALAALSLRYLRSGSLASISAAYPSDLGMPGWAATPGAWARVTEAQQRTAPGLEALSRASLAQSRDLGGNRMAMVPGEEEVRGVRPGMGGTSSNQAASK